MHGISTRPHKSKATMLVVDEGFVWQHFALLNCETRFGYSECIHRQLATCLRGSWLTKSTVSLSCTGFYVLHVDDLWWDSFGTWVTCSKNVSEETSAKICRFSASKSAEKVRYTYDSQQNDFFFGSQQAKLATSLARSFLVSRDYSSWHAIWDNIGKLGLRFSRSFGLWFTNAPLLTS